MLHLYRIRSVDKKAPSVQMNPLFKKKKAITKQLAVLKGNSLC